jgi:hypothetical protein
MNRCRVCGASMQAKRRDARCCSPACRREAARVRASVAGKSDGPCETLADLAARRQRRAKPPQGMTRLNVERPSIGLEKE